MIRVWLVAAITSCIIFRTHGASVDTLKHCCGLGSNYASSGLECSTFQTPIAGVEKEDETQCLKSVDVCCKNQYKNLQCNLGQNDAKSGSCANSAEGERKDCCEACQIGIESGTAGDECVNSLGFSQNLDSAFVSCCKQATKTTTPTTERLSSPSTEAKDTSTTSSSENNLPSMEVLCESGEVCAQICTPTKDSYKCSCHKGYVLMTDGISCKPEKLSKKKGRCANSPCDHFCTDTGTAIKCSCRDGYELANDQKTCKDIDECTEGNHECLESELCVNDIGTYYCEVFDTFEEDTNEFNDKCPVGYKFNGEKLTCDDIDECQFGIMCTRPKICKNTIGSFICEGDDTPQCPPGFHYKASVESCTDIDECITGENDCNKESQVCLNTKGNYTCIDKASRNKCPPGFKKNTDTQLCEDINECEEDPKLCKDDEICINEEGGHTCEPRPKVSKAYTVGTTPTYIETTTLSTTPQPVFKPVSCPKGFRFDEQTRSCPDINECKEDEEICDSNQDCLNTPGSFVCNCKTGFTKDFKTGACADINECQIGTHDCSVAQRCDNTIGSFLCARITGCGTGYTLNYGNGLCEDDDECALGTHNCNQLGPKFKCRNILGSYRCEAERTSPKPQIFRPPMTPTAIMPQIYRPKQVPASSPTPNNPQVYRPPPVQPIFTPPPPPQSTAPTETTTVTPYVANSMPYFRPTPTYPLISGQRKHCLPGYIMNSNGGCDDIDECANNPCKRGERCINFNGNYQCMSALQCKLGFELNEAGEECVDVNECTRGTHKCNPTQICKNAHGYYTCECPQGHHLSRITQMCEDLDECKYYRPCSINSECINTPGSYICDCKAGFKKTGNFNCEDVDECKEHVGLCQQHCVNTWGSYRCACRKGFTLHYDNSTCIDIDECERFKDKKLCIGNCKNIPGSYTCECPRGYKLGSDGRVCLDINECEQSICPNPDDVCLNVRGGYKCYTIHCPPGYIKDKPRCKRSQSYCDPRNNECILQPEQYTYQYITLVSDLPLPDGPIQLFQIKGPGSAFARADFAMTIDDVQCPYSVPKVDERYFRKTFKGLNSMQLHLVRSMQGPQEIRLKIEMRVYQGSTLAGSAVVYIVIVVSEYPF